MHTVELVWMYYYECTEYITMNAQEVLTQREWMDISRLSGRSVTVNFGVILDSSLRWYFWYTIAMITLASLNANLFPILIIQQVSVTTSIYFCYHSLGPAPNGMYENPKSFLPRCRSGINCRGSVHNLGDLWISHGHISICVCDVHQSHCEHFKKWVLQQEWGHCW